MDVELDHASPVPLYHQLAEALRYQIATGAIAAGSTLLPLRRAAERAGVNLHTVRQAYAELARAGIVVTSTPEGTRVLPTRIPPARTGDAASREDIALAIAREARLRHGIELDELIALLRSAQAPTEREAISVVECSATQSQDLATQLEQRWRIRAVPWVLGRSEPPRGLVIATYFHYNDIRRAWPERLPEVRFLPIAPEPALAERLRSSKRRSTGRRARSGTLDVTLCERDDAMARNIAADLVRILPARAFRVVIRVVAKAEDALVSAGAGTRVLFSPRMWGELSARARGDPRAYELRYVFEPGAVDALATEKAWSPR